MRERYALPGQTSRTNATRARPLGLSALPPPWTDRRARPGSTWAAPEVYAVVRYGPAPVPSGTAQPEPQDQAPLDDAVPAPALRLEPVPPPPLQRAAADLAAPGLHGGPLHRHRGLPGAAGGGGGRGRPARGLEAVRGEAAAARGQGRLHHRPLGRGPGLDRPPERGQARPAHDEEEGPEGVRDQRRAGRGEPRGG